MEQQKLYFEKAYSFRKQSLCEGQYKLPPLGRFNFTKKTIYLPESMFYKQFNPHQFASPSLNQIIEFYHLAFNLRYFYDFIQI